MLEDRQVVGVVEGRHNSLGHKWEHMLVGKQEAEVVVEHYSMLEYLLVHKLPGKVEEVGQPQLLLQRVRNNWVNMLEHKSKGIHQHIEGSVSIQSLVALKKSLGLDTI